MRSLPVDLLRSLLRYEVDTGHFYWRERALEHFVSCRYPNRARSIWNARYADKMAGTDFQGYMIIGFKTFGVGAILGHRLAWAMHYVVWPDGPIDHDNRNRSDNRIKNLSDSTRLQNQRNHPLHSHNTSGAGGISWDAKRCRWKAYIGITGKQKFLGRFINFGAAVEARLLAQKAAGFHPNHGQ